MKSGCSSLELLETRIAPAAAVSFIDPDGDTVLISSSKGNLAALNSAILITDHHLAKLTLTDSIFAGAKISVLVTELGEAGDGLTNVGYIDASGISLSAVTIGGDLGKIVAGTANSKLGLASLTVSSLGRQGAASGAPDLESIITGRVGAVRILGDVDEAHFQVTGTGGNVTISGNLIGGIAERSGSIEVLGRSLGNVTVSGDIIGGKGAHSGKLEFPENGLAGAIKVNGSIIGGDAFEAGSLRGGRTASLLIGGNLVGGSLVGTGLVVVSPIGSFTIAGDLIGGEGSYSGSIALTGRAGAVTIGGDMKGGNGEHSGYLLTSLPIKSLNVGGSVLGGAGPASGAMSIVNVGSITIGGDVKGGPTSYADINKWCGFVFAGTVKTIVIKGSIMTNDFGGGGQVFIEAATSVKIMGDVLGRNVNDPSSGRLTVQTSLQSLEIGGSLTKTVISIGDQVTKPNTVLTRTLHIGGSVSQSSVYIGSSTRNDINAGRIAIDGNWIASNLIIGARNLGADDVWYGVEPDNVNFGDVHDSRSAIGRVERPSRVESITIGGAIEGTADDQSSTDHFGFLAGQIKSFQVGGFRVPLNAGGSNDFITFAHDQDVSIHEIS